MFLLPTELCFDHDSVWSWVLPWIGFLFLLLLWNSKYYILNNMDWCTAWNDTIWAVCIGLLADWNTDHLISNSIWKVGLYRAIQGSCETIKIWSTGYPYLLDFDLNWSRAMINPVPMVNLTIGPLLTWFNTCHPSLPSLTLSLTLTTSKLFLTLFLN